MSMPDLMAAARQRMVQDQLLRRAISSQRVLEAMGTVPRERFVPPELQSEAYADRALPIDCGQTISQPYIVALMTEALALTGREKVLEVGTGSGYQTAVLGLLAREVVSIERHPELSVQARRVLEELGYDNLTLVVGDGTLGWPDRAPYDRIIVTAGAAHIPPALWEQLVEGGTLVIPLGEYDAQVLEAIRKIAGQPQRMVLTGCRFVPLVGAQQP
jgi:protein-L-isoaspartate(D-aspartate) O-methyltransferase